MNFNINYVCGINGIATIGKINENARDILVEMNELIKHRGPDDDGFIILMLIYIHLDGYASTFHN
jgi:asparagine synthetase B (glutamine-hydrolysing)